MLSVQEKFTRFTPFGIRFWDPVEDRQIVGGLRVTARPAQRGGKKIPSVETQGAVHAFCHLPGLHDVETGVLSPEEAVASGSQRQFIIEIRDSFGRYLDVAFPIALPLPYRGLFLSDIGGSPAQNSPRGFYLYSATTRRLPVNYAQVGGQLLDQLTGKPAAHALVTVTTEHGERWFGLADAEGRFVVAMPYPDLPAGFGGSPAMAQVPMHEQSWNIDLEVAYSPVTLEVLPGTDVPSYMSVLNQTAAEIFPSDPEVSAATVAQLSLLLEFNQPTVTRTDGQSYLFVSPSVS